MMPRVSTSRPLEHDSVHKDYASSNNKLKLDDDDDDKDSGDNSHHVPVPMSCDDPKVAQNDTGDNSLSPNVLLFSEEEARQHFARWCHRYGPIYADEQEERYRFSVFKKELEWVTHQQNLGVACSINDYSHLTHEEKLSLLFCRNCDSESDTEQDHTQEPHAEKEKGYLSEDASDDDAFG